MWRPAGGGWGQRQRCAQLESPEVEKGSRDATLSRQVRLCHGYNVIFKKSTASWSCAINYFINQDDGQ